MVDHTDSQLGNARIHHVLKRKSVFERKAVGSDNEVQIVAANIDIVLICMSLNNDYNTSRLERYLSVAWNSRATPVVVLTKSDLCDDLPGALSQVSNIALGADIVITSSFDSDSYEKLFSYIKPDITASFIGSSGVGKSTFNQSTGRKTSAFHCEYSKRR